MILEELDQDGLEAVAVLVARVNVINAVVANLEDELKQYMEELRRLTEESLPASMSALGLRELTLVDGSSLKVEPTVQVSISKAREVAAYEWLREHQLGDVIKNEVSIRFGKDQDNDADQLAEMLERNGYAVNRRETVHPSTLRALAREKFEAGDPLPEDLFGTRIFNRAIIKRT